MKKTCLTLAVILLAGCSSPFTEMPTFGEAKSRTDNYFNCGWGAYYDSPACVDPGKDGRMDLSLASDSIIQFWVSPPDDFNKDGPYFEQVSRARVYRMSIFMSRADRSAVVDYVSDVFGYEPGQVETALNTGAPVVRGPFRIRSVQNQLLIEKAE